MFARGERSRAVTTGRSVESLAVVPDGRSAPMKSRVFGPATRDQAGLSLVLMAIVSLVGCGEVVGEAERCGGDGICRASCVADPDCALVGDAAVDAGVCQVSGLSTCRAATCDDGVLSASKLGRASLDCVVNAASPVLRTWSEAANYCASLGAGYRLPTKGEALQIAYEPTVCATPLPRGWYTWTATCAMSEQAWCVTFYGRTFAYETASSDATELTVCVR